MTKLILSLIALTTLGIATSQAHQYRSLCRPNYACSPQPACQPSYCPTPVCYRPPVCTTPTTYYAPSSTVIYIGGYSGGTYVRNFYNNRPCNSGSQVIYFGGQQGAQQGYQFGRRR